MFGLKHVRASPTAAARRALACGAAAATLDGRVQAPIAPQLLYAEQLQGRAPSEVQASCSRIAL